MDWRPPLNCTTLESLPSGSHDWLFHTQSLRCGCGDWDNHAWTVLSRSFLPSLYALAAAALVAICRLPSWTSGAAWDDAESLSDSEAEDREAELKVIDDGTPVMPKKAERMWHLDYARILCIACTVVEHAGGKNYSDSNVLWVQQWVLPYLYLVSGYAFMFSRSPLVAYELRLFGVLVIGVCANWLADVITGRDWKGDFGNTVFQMAYVILLMVLSSVTAPLRGALIWRAKNPNGTASKACVAWTVCWGLISGTALVSFIFGLPFFDEGPSGFLSELRGSGLTGLLVQGPLIMSELGTLLFFCLLACALGDSHGLLGWLLMVVIYVPRWVIPYNRGGHPLNADLYMLGMVLQQVPLRGVMRLKAVVREYWPLSLAVILLLSTPDVNGRCDLHPMNTYWERLRFYTIECIFVIFLVSGAAHTSDSFGVTLWLNNWSLFAYCFHVAFARVLPVPYGAALIFATIPIFFLASQSSRRPARAHEVEAGVGDDAEESE